MYSAALRRLVAAPLRLKPISPPPRSLLHTATRLPNANTRRRSRVAYSTSAPPSEAEPPAPTETDLLDSEAGGSPARTAPEAEPDLSRSQLPHLQVSSASPDEPTAFPENEPGPQSEPPENETSGSAVPSEVDPDEPRSKKLTVDLPALPPIPDYPCPYVTGDELNEYLKPLYRCRWTVAADPCKRVLGSAIYPRILVLKKSFLFNSFRDAVRFVEAIADIAKTERVSRTIETRVTIPRSNFLDVASPRNYNRVQPSSHTRPYP